ncbi:hypothetical protein ARTHRO9AX_180178 [Arthrobacter sp. 9AX]|nr:hypothetical protein ARTHRO9AX_180178 [Arthrobacter sp. 9AX]
MPTILPMATLETLPIGNTPTRIKGPDRRAGRRRRPAYAGAGQPDAGAAKLNGGAEGS